jgi:FSR family fosmidomycin resistance protein-like MFS transporter
LVFGVREAAWPAIRRDLGLDYAAIGALLTIPGLVSGVLEPFIGLLGNSPKRRAIIVAGGVAFAVALALLSLAGSFSLLLIAFVVMYPASGAFVSLSQASLMDIDPTRHEKLMARWVLAGSVGVVMGPIAFAVATRMGWGWRPLFLALAVGTVPLVVQARLPIHTTDAMGDGFRESARTAWKALRNGAVLRWLLLLEITDLLGDVLAGFLSIYFVDVVHVSIGTAALAVLVWTGAGFVGDALMVPLLDRVDGVSYLRVSALLALFIFPSLLLAPGLIPKLVLLATLSVVRAGWYAVPQGRLYSELHGNSGVVVALSNVAGIPATTFPLIIGLLAQRFGLQAALWCCAIAPVGLLLGLPSGIGNKQGSEE